MWMRTALTSMEPDAIKFTKTKLSPIAWLTYRTVCLFLNVALLRDCVHGRTVQIHSQL